MRPNNETLCRVQQDIWISFVDVSEPMLSPSAYYIVMYASLVNLPPIIGHMTSQLVHTCGERQRPTKFQLRSCMSYTEMWLKRWFTVLHTQHNILRTTFEGRVALIFYSHCILRKKSH